MAMKSINFGHGFFILNYLTKIFRDQSSLTLDAIANTTKQTQESPKEVMAITSKPVTSQKVPTSQITPTPPAFPTSHNLTTSQTSPLSPMANPLPSTSEIPQPPQETNKINDSEFLPAICHDLKTPLSAIICFSEELENEIIKVRAEEALADGGENKNHKFLKNCFDNLKEIKNAAAVLDELVKDLLDVSNKGASNFSINLSEVNISDIIKQSLKLNACYAMRRKINIKTVISDELTTIKTDPKRMKQILTNLISNAVKYSPENSEVKIIAYKNNNHLEIIISDQGFGMTEAQVAVAFEKFTTLPNPNSNKIDSFGIGLAIVNQLIELLNGDIAISSEVGKGTEVRLQFR